MAGPKVTAEMVVEALRVLLPPELQFLISDRGTHFKADAFKMLMLSEEFIHVFVPAIALNPMASPNDLCGPLRNGWLISPGQMTKN